MHLVQFPFLCTLFMPDVFLVLVQWSACVDMWGGCLGLLGMIFFRKASSINWYTFSVYSWSGSHMCYARLWFWKDEAEREESVSLRTRLYLTTLQTQGASKLEVFAIIMEIIHQQNQVRTKNVNNKQNLNKKKKREREIRNSLKIQIIYLYIICQMG